MTLIKTSFFESWLSFSSGQSIVECDFIDLKETAVTELLGDFSKERLIAFGEHASGSLLAFYSKDNESSVEETPVAWLDSEGSPCIIVSNNLKEFLSILPYGMGFVYTVASFIEDNFGEDEILSNARKKMTQNANELLEESRKRFLSIDDLLNWLVSKNIQPADDPVKLIIEAHERNSDLTPWIATKLT